MALVRVAVPIYMPEWLRSTLRRIKRTFRPPEKPDIDLVGDRDIEWSFVASHLPCGPGEALDFGCDGTYLSLIAARRGFQVVALDLERQAVPWQHPNRHFVQRDLLAARLADASFDLVVNCSSVEHVGLVGRYSVSEPLPDGDLEAMRTLRSLMKPKGIQLLTIPVGRDSVFYPWHRVYGKARLPLLLDCSGLQIPGFPDRQPAPLQEPPTRVAAPSGRPPAIGQAPSNHGLRSFNNLPRYCLSTVQADPESTAQVGP